MPWARLDDQILDNVKIADAGIVGFAVHIAAITWCCRNMTDGRLPFSAARRLFDFVSLTDEIIEYVPAGAKMQERLQQSFYDLPDITVDAVAKRLVACGLWEEAEGGWQVHDFLVYNPSREQIMAEREARSKAGREGARRRWNGSSHDDSHSSSHGSAHGATHGTRSADGLAKRWQNDAPDPDPDPDPGSRSRSAAAASRPPRARAKPGKTPKASPKATRVDPASHDEQTAPREPTRSGTPAAEQQHFSNDFSESEIQAARAAEASARARMQARSAHVEGSSGPLRDAPTGQRAPRAPSGIGEILSGGGKP